MPTLVVGARNGETGEPIIWYCSDCETAFAPPRMKYTQADLRKIDQKFRKHSQDAHAEITVIGLNLPPEEDVNQAAARIVREATKD